VRSGPRVKESQGARVDESPRAAVNVHGFDASSQRNRLPWRLLRISQRSQENQEIERAPTPMTVGRASACNIRIRRRRRLLQARRRSGARKVSTSSWTWGPPTAPSSTTGTSDREQLNDGDLIMFGMTKASFVGEKPKAARKPEPAPAAAGGAAGAQPARAAAVAAPEGSSRTSRARKRFSVAPRRGEDPGRAGDRHLAGKVAFFEEENRKLKVLVKQVQEQAAHDAAASAGRTRRRSARFSSSAKRS